MIASVLGPSFLVFESWEKSQESRVGGPRALNQKCPHPDGKLSQ